MPKSLNRQHRPEKTKQRKTSDDVLDESVNLKEVIEIVNINSLINDNEIENEDEIDVDSDDDAMSEDSNTYGAESPPIVSKVTRRMPTIFGNEKKRFKGSSNIYDNTKGVAEKESSMEEEDSEPEITETELEYVKRVFGVRVFELIKMKNEKIRSQCMKIDRYKEMTMARKKKMLNLNKSNKVLMERHEGLLLEIKSLKAKQLFLEDKLGLLAFIKETDRY